MAILTAEVIAQHNDWEHFDLVIKLDDVIVKRSRVAASAISEITADDMLASMERLVKNHLGSGKTLSEVNTLLPAVTI